MLDGIMMGSFKPLLDFIRRGSVSIERTHDEMFLLSSTKSSSGAKASTNLRTMAKTERAVNKVRKIQYRLGYMSDEHAAVAARSGFFTNLSVSASDFRYATALAGPDIPMLKGKGTVDRKMEYEDLVPQLADGELLLEIDIGYIGQHGFLIVLQHRLITVSLFIWDQKVVTKTDEICIMQYSKCAA